MVELRRLVAAGRPGDRLESSRSLVGRLGVSPVTVQRALDVVRTEGLVDTRPGAGTFVLMPSAAPPPVDVSWQSAVLDADPVDVTALQRLRPVVAPGEVVLSSGYLDPSLQAGDLLSTATRRVLRRSGAWEHTTPTGDPDLRAWLAERIGGGRTAADVVVTPGGQAAVAATIAALTRPGDTLIVESPTYPGAVIAARANGCRLVAWPTETGADPALLDELLAATGARAVFAQSRFANPTGRSWDPETRRAVLEVARRRRCFVIDDDWAADLSLDPSEGDASLVDDDRGGHVVTVRSLTKLVAPGLRVAAISAVGPARDRVAAACLTATVSVSSLVERVAVETLTAPTWPRHLRQLRSELGERRDVLVDEVTRWLGDDAVDRPDGGLHVWVRLPDAWSAERLAADAAAAGVVVSPGDGWYPAEAPGPRLRLSFSAADAPAIRRGVRTLARVSPG